MQLKVSLTFEAAHFLTEGVPDDSPCRRLHGHSYRMEVTIDGPPPEKDGIMVDSDGVKSLIRRNLDHQHLNEVLKRATPLRANPSLENVALYAKQLITDSLLKGTSYRVYCLSVQEGFDGAKVVIGWETNT